MLVTASKVSGTIFMIIKKVKSTIQNYFQDNSGVCGAHADFVAIA